MYYHSVQLTFEVGVAIGSSFKSLFLQFIRDYTPLDQMLIPYYQSADGRRVCDSFLESNRYFVFFELKQIQRTVPAAH
jgi:hypothetical protein